MSGLFVLDEERHGHIEGPELRRLDGREPPVVQRAAREAQPDVCAGTHRVSSVKVSSEATKRRGTGHAQEDRTVLRTSTDVVYSAQTGGRVGPHSPPKRLSATSIHRSGSTSTCHHPPSKTKGQARSAHSPAIRVVPELRDGLGVEGPNAAPQALRTVVVLVPRHKHSAAGSR